MGVRRRAARVAKNQMVEYFGAKELTFLSADIDRSAAKDRRLRTLTRRHPHGPEIQRQFLGAVDLIYYLYRQWRDQVRAAFTSIDLKRLRSEF